MLPIDRRWRRFQPVAAFWKVTRIRVLNHNSHAPGRIALFILRVITIDRVIGGTYQIVACVVHGDRPKTMLRFVIRRKSAFRERQDIVVLSTQRLIVMLGNIEIDRLDRIMSTNASQRLQRSPGDEVTVLSRSPYVKWRIRPAVDLFPATFGQLFE